MSKLWSVAVSVSFDMPVYAETKEEAETVAKENWEEEYGNQCFMGPDYCQAHEIKKAGDFEGCIPWGIPEGSEHDDMTVDEILGQ